jgi:hypothetical protein
MYPTNRSSSLSPTRELATRQDQQAVCLGSFNGVDIQYDPAADGLVNATQMCKAAGREWSGYWRLQSTQEFIDELSTVLQIHRTTLVHTVQGGLSGEQGTWVHRRVAVHLANWCSPAFAVWVTEKIERLMMTGRVVLHREHQEAELASRGDEVAAIYQLVNEVRASNAHVRMAMTCWAETLKALQRATPERLEKAVQDMLVKREGGQIWVKLESGTIDVVTSTDMIEVKHWKQYKHAIGQILMYERDVIAAYGSKRNKRVHLFWKPFEEQPSDRQRRQIETECSQRGVSVTWHEWSELESPQSRQTMLPLAFAD